MMIKIFKYTNQTIRNIRKLNQTIFEIEKIT